jgi:hypothetical protein
LILIYQRKKKIDIVAAIEALCFYGWDLIEGTTIGYLPLGDKDDFNWKYVPLELKAKVLEELRKKQLANEIIGITISYKNTEAGANLLFLPEENQISLSLADETKLPNGINDFELYEQKLLPWIFGEKIKFDSIKLMQTDSGGQIKYEKQILG